MNWKHHFNTEVGIKKQANGYYLLEIEVIVMSIWEKMNVLICIDLDLLCHQDPMILLMLVRLSQGTARKRPTEDKEVIARVLSAFQKIASGTNEAKLLRKILLIFI